MLFNSLEYAVFLTVVFFAFWFLFRKNLKLQNVFLLIAGYVFYAWWDWRFLSLIIFVSFINYFSGIQIEKSDNWQKRKLLLLFTFIIDLGLLGVFKYFNFFAESAADLLNAIGFKADHLTLNIILPVGISFYTFQTMGYVIDIYREKLEPEKNIISFFTFVSFFPLVLAGPIERGGNLLPQLAKRKEFDYDLAADGMRQILWGLFKKAVIADNCAVLANKIFENYQTQSGLELIFGAIFFALQVYGDFSGYSDMAIGSAKLLGFKLTTNFKTPYFSRDIAEFWRRWHISLSTWFRDYLFIPLNLQLRNFAKLGIVISVIITFTLCGFWHGANWTFLFWGALHGLYFVPLLLSKQKGQNLNPIAFGKVFPNIKETFQMAVTFALTCFAWIFFKAESIGTAFGYIGKIFSNKFIPENYGFFPKYMIFLISIFLLLEWFLFRYDDYPEKIQKLNPVLRHVSYSFMLILIFLFMQNEASTFIYFQF